MEAIKVIFVYTSLKTQHGITTWGCSSNGRALALHARGTGFDTLHLHFYREFLLKESLQLYT